MVEALDDSILILIMWLNLQKFHKGQPKVTTIYIGNAHLQMLALEILNSLLFYNGTFWQSYIIPWETEH